MKRVLNLYCGIGGNRKNWKGVKVTAVENDPNIAAAYKKLFPEDEVIIADAHDFLLKNFSNYDIIWSSPPCPTHSKLRLSHKAEYYPDMKLYQEIIFLKHFFKGKFIVENVIPYYDTLIKPSIEIDRHLFWCNFEVGNFKVDRSKKDVSRDTKEGLAEYKNLKEVLDLDIKNKRLILRNAVLPSVGEFLINGAMENGKIQNT